jgi:hypothetical protein
MPSTSKPAASPPAKQRSPTPEALSSKPFDRLTPAEVSEAMHFVDDLTAAERAARIGKFAKIPKG